jgi:predicted nucleic acid-binding protein
MSWLEGVLPAAAKVDVAIAGGAVMSWINVGEVHYMVQRHAGEDRARQVVRELRRRLTLDLPTVERVLAAASIKAVHPLAYADAFAVATALAHEATLCTGDPEIINGDPGWRVEDLR